MDFSISLSGLRVAQRAIELVGTNIANASTAGYHRQDVVIQPLESERMGGVPIGGAEIRSYRRAIDTLLEDQILRQRPQISQMTQELTTLQSLQSALGGLDSASLNGQLDRFFGALREVAGNPTSQPLREQAVWAADSLAANFRGLGGLLGSLDDRAFSEAQILIEQVNGLAEEVAGLNGEICAMTLRGGNANLLTDRRDQAVSELAELVQLEITVRADGSGAVDVWVWGTPLVFQGHYSALEVDVVTGGKLGLVVQNGFGSNTEVRGGKLGGLFSLRNDLLAEIQTDLDNLADAFMREINGSHLQGVGLTGSFDELIGVGIADPDAALADWDQGITTGSMRLRLLAPSGQVTYYSVAIDADTDTLNTVAAKLAALAPAALSASVADGALRLQGLAGNEFDFLPTGDLQLGAPWTGTSTPAATGIYTGAANDTFTFTAKATGRVGVDADLTVEVRNGAGELLTTLDVGNGYAAGDRLPVHEGIEVAFGIGTVTDGETFVVEALASSDPTGFLAAAGIGALFEGTGATDMAVRQEILDDSRRLATAEGAEMSDNSAVRKMADAGERSLAALGGLSVNDASRLFVTGVGQRIALRDTRLTALQNVMQQLENHREQISGVDVNEEAAKLLIFEQMFQGLAKYLATQKDAMETLINLL
ncbi:MAG TPA: flagellar hook-associated protein FlgK [Phycisphaerae bacterium]|nr:flagellar hook-associated protein FlgK [Phycisphaerae bacterium]